jgi:hypothetical protein
MIAKQLGLIMVTMVLSLTGPNVPAHVGRTFRVKIEHRF